MDIPLFNDQIFSRLTTTLTTYNQQYHILTVLTAAVLIPYIFYRLLKKSGFNNCPQLFPTDCFTFNRRHKSQTAALLLLSAAFFFYVIILYQSEMSFFKDFDSMHWSGFQTSHQSPDLLNAFHRFFPLGHAEWLFLYNLTPNFYLLNLFLVAQLAFCLGLFYRLLDFIPVTKRLLAATLFMLCPAVFTTFNGHIFTERNGIMLLLLGLLFFKKYNRNGKKIFLWFSILSFDLLLYFKEINILLLLGFLAFSFMWNLWHEKITLAKFKQPLRLICEFPFEFLLFVCCLIFTILFDRHIPLNDPYYLSLLPKSWASTLSVYFFEIILCLTALLIFINRLRLKTASLWPDGFLCGALLFSGWIIFTRLVHFEPYLHNSYLHAPASIIFIIYIYTVIKNKYLINTLSCVFLCTAVIINIFNQQLEEGKYFRETATFLTSRTENVYLDFQIDQYWHLQSFFRAAVYYHPDRDFNFKPFLFKIINNTFQTRQTSAPLEKGDLYLHYRGFNQRPPYFPDKYQYRPIYSNPVITIYEVQ